MVTIVSELEFKSKHGIKCPVIVLRNSFIPAGPGLEKSAVGPIYLFYLFR
jgi:hypothetical protein